MTGKVKRRVPDKEYYFGQAEEDAVIAYLTTNDYKEKNQIYETKLKVPLERLVSSIIKSWGYKYGAETYEETFDEALTYLIDKLPKYNVKSKKKAYSYYGTVCRNHLKERFENKVRKDDTCSTFNMGEDNFSNNLRYSVIIEDESIEKEIIKRLIIRIRYMVDHYSDINLRENEIKVGKALIKVLEYWEDIMSGRGSDKFNKKEILKFLREETNLNTKIIRDNMKKYYREYNIIKNKIVNSCS